MRGDSDKRANRPGVTRRGFIATVGAGAAAAVITGRAAAKPGAEPGGDALVACALTVNGKHHALRVEPRCTLLSALRDVLGLTGTKPGCERGECGACTVLIDGQARYACMTLALEAQGHAITTVEGLMDGEDLGPVQQAFVAEDAFQCGYCTPGQVMAAEALLRNKPDPTLDEIRQGMSGNLCRCGAYAHIFKAVRRAAEAKRQGGGR